ncbi:hypothetical protein NC651_032339 [Populus alba x Populus x berolinensis]|nr:hypothetical protein NC651_032339 [Populus alba x Populus x berolinensis]
MDPRWSFFWFRMPVLIWNLAFSYMSIGNSIWPMSIRTYNTPFDAITTAISQAANFIHLKIEVSVESDLSSEVDEVLLLKRLSASLFAIAPLLEQ